MGLLSTFSHFFPLFCTCASGKSFVADHWCRCQYNYIIYWWCHNVDVDIQCYICAFLSYTQYSTTLTISCLNYYCRCCFCCIVYVPFQIIAMLSHFSIAIQNSPCSWVILNTSHQSNYTRNICTVNLAMRSIKKYSLLQPWNHIFNELAWFNLGHPIFSAFGNAEGTILLKEWDTINVEKLAIEDTGFEFWVSMPEPLVLVDI